MQLESRRVNVQNREDPDDVTIVGLHVYLHPLPAVAEPLLFSRRPEHSTPEHQPWLSIANSISEMSISIFDFITNIIRLLRALSVKHHSWICKCPQAFG